MALLTRKSEIRFWCWSSA